MFFGLPIDGNYDDLRFIPEGSLVPSPPNGGLAHLLDILILPLGHLPTSWQAPPCLAISNVTALFDHLRESYSYILLNETNLHPI